MGMRANDTVVVDGGAGVEDGVCADAAAGLNYGASHDLSTVGDVYLPTDDGAGVNDADKRVSGIGKMPVKVFAALGRLGRADAVDQGDIAGRVVPNLIIAAQHGNAENAGSVGRRIGIERA